MFRFLKAWIRKWQAKKAEEDIRVFLNYLKGGDEEEIASVVAIATVMRYEVNNFNVPLDKLLKNGLLATSGEIAEIQYFLSQTLQEMQSIDQPLFATGLMVWLHSVRALQYPEIRIFAREMWGELGRGFNGAENFLLVSKELLPISVSKISEYEFSFIPVGLEPFVKE